MGFRHCLRNYHVKFQLFFGSTSGAFIAEHFEDGGFFTVSKFSHSVHKSGSVFRLNFNYGFWHGELCDDIGRQNGVELLTQSHFAGFDANYLAVDVTSAVCGEAERIANRFEGVTLFAKVKHSVTASGERNLSVGFVVFFDHKTDAQTVAL
jgi:hypothetical protein